MSLTGTKMKILYFIVLYFSHLAGSQCTLHEVKESRSQEILNCREEKRFGSHFCCHWQVKNE